MASSSKLKRNLEEEAEALSALQLMESDEKYSTPSRYSSNVSLYPDNLMSFSSMHMAYLRKYPDVDLGQYIQNLRLSTLIR